MKKFVFSLLAVSIGITAQALPKVGYYKTKHSDGQGSFTCSQVLSNTKQVTVFGKKVTYFEAKDDTGEAFTCIPQVFLDTDDTPIDGDPTRFIFTSLSTAFCLTTDGSRGLEVSFDANRVFWGGESHQHFVLPGTTTPAAVKVKQRQTSYAEFFSTTSCP